MLRSTCFALLAFACLFSSGNSDQELWRDSIRNVESQAIAQRIRDEFTQSTETPQYLRPAPPPQYMAPPAPQQYIAPQAPPQYVAPSAQPQYIAPTPPLLSPGLVSGAGGSAFAAPAASYPSRSGADNVDVATSDAIARNILGFGQYLMQTINTSFRKTTIFSPLSITSALALLLLGAKGRSHAELSAVFGQNDIVKMHEQLGLLLQDVQVSTVQAASPQRQLDAWHSHGVNRSLRNYPKNRNSPPEVHVANGIFVQQGLSLNPDYRQALTQIYKSAVQVVDFSGAPATAKFTINSWVEDQTKGKIQNILSDEANSDTRIILANALYFKAMWEIDFIGGLTKVEDFFPNGEGTQPAVPVDMMVGTGAFPYYEDSQLNCRILGLPYHGNLSTMYIIQPMKSSIEQLAYLEQGLNADNIEYMISKMGRVSAIVAFPKLHITESLQLRDYLKKMNLGGVFTGIQDDLSLIFDSGVPRRVPSNRRTRSDGHTSLQNLQAQREAQQGPTQRAKLLVSEVLHKVDFVVDEKGTEAAAASAAVIKKSGPEILFRADTPFILLVRHDLTKLPLFYGMINEPPRAKAGQSSRRPVLNTESSEFN